MYSETICEIYNAFGWNYYPEAFAGRLLSWIHTNDLPIRSALDLGCGTGELPGILAESGIDAWGVDIAEGMIAISRRKYPEARFELGDMTRYQPGRRFDLITSTCDALNHLLTPELLRAALRNAYELLEPDGWLIFDVLKRSETEHLEPLRIGTGEAGEVWCSIRRSKPDLPTLTVSLRRGEETLHTEQVIERCYPEALVLDMMRGIGYRDIQRGDLLPGETGPQKGIGNLLVSARK